MVLANHMPNIFKVYSRKIQGRIRMLCESEGPVGFQEYWPAAASHLPRDHRVATGWIRRTIPRCMHPHYPVLQRLPTQEQEREVLTNGPSAHP